MIFITGCSCEYNLTIDDDTYKEVLGKLKYDAVFYGHRHVERKDIINNCTFYGLDSRGCTKDENTFYYIVNIKLLQ